MTLSPGTRLGPYHVVAQIGSGGMGEIYRATDTNLKRSVAIKVLPESVAADGERLARFQREAEVLASLNHPNIAHIHSLEKSAGVTAIVMELVEGSTLADRIAQGPIVIHEALPIAKQIAEALEAAHEKGIIHRDLKPANIKITPDGVVKVLDFGLAKLAEAPDPSTGSYAQTTSPTITSPALTTRVGMLLGTAAYMSPEQAMGRAADKRSDVWGFGCVLYEMLTARRAFQGADPADTLSAVLHNDPEWTALPTGLPPPIRVFVQGCLTKDRVERISDISTARFVLRHVEALTDQHKPSVSPVLLRRVAFAATVTLVVGAAAAAGLTWLATRSDPPRVSRTTIELPAEQPPLFGPVGPDLVLTPAGTDLIYSTGERLVVRPIDQLTVNVIATSFDVITTISASPDGQSIAYIDGNNHLKKVATKGGSQAKLLRMDGSTRGAAWADDNSIVFATSSLTTGLQRISADGGEATVLTRPDPNRGELDHVWPERLPEGRGVLFTVLSTGGALDAARIAVLDTATGSWTTVVAGHHARYVPTGHLVYVEAGALRAVAFDLGRLRVRGAPITMLSKVRNTVLGAGQFTVSNDGTLAYADASRDGTSEGKTIVWVDRQGRETPLPLMARAFQTLRVSPDGTRIALSSADEEVDLWSWDARRATLTRETFDAGVDLSPVWMPDGRRVIYTSQRTRGVRNLHMQTLGGDGTPVRLAESANVQGPTSVTPDGKMAVFDEQSPSTGRDLWLLPMMPPGPAKPLWATRFEERNAVVSPNGRWLAYESDSSGQLEVYVRPFPNLGDAQWQVSTGGGRVPLWAPKGHELFYVSGNGTLVARSVDAERADWNAGRPVQVAANIYNYVVPPERNYDVSTDGQRFLMLKPNPAERASSQIIIVQNWFEELKRLVPTN